MKKVIHPKINRHGIPTKPNRTGKSTANDIVATSPWAAKWIVDYFKPSGKCLEPAKGNGVFFNLLPNGSEWCEISEGRDFMEYSGNVDWIITNPPYSIYDDFLLKSFSVAKNIVFLAPFQKVFKSKKIDQETEKFGGLYQAVMMGGGQSVGFPFGFPVGCLHYVRGYRGPIHLIRAYDWIKDFKEKEKI